MRLIKGSLLIAVIVSMVGFSGSLLAQTNSNAKEEGERLTRQIWEDVKNGNLQAINKTYSNGFQALDLGVIKSKTDELKSLQSIKLGNYTLSNFNVTKVNNNYITTYTAVVDEVWDGKVVSSEPKGRLEVWEKSNSGWKIIARANANSNKK
jgi:hypothetical protein